MGAGYDGMARLSRLYEFRFKKVVDSGDFKKWRIFWGYARLMRHVGAKSLRNVGKLLTKGKIEGLGFLEVLV